ncbi:hypothetical protein [Konateibacter massiliensis]|uniref:hypothetical protein n=1 Tax=Konateibacter massiliensis TaxID=2002841 RepID=UPI000C15F23B|nr:hypothetical protein [Konateibacter massiliensis]
MAREEKTLFSFDYPEIKADMCVTGWTKVPCPTLRNPGRTCRQDIKTPCTKRRTSRFRVYAYVTYPDNLEEAVKKQIDECHKVGVAAATTIVYSAATASSLATPVAQMSAAIASIPAALQAYGKAFWGCITSLSITDAIRNQIKYDITHQTFSLSDWK